MQLCECSAVGVAGVDALPVVASVGVGVLWSVVHRIGVDRLRLVVLM